MDYIKYETTLKASGREYSKIVFWNRFIRNPIELILTWLPAAITIVCIALGCFSSYLAVIYAACWCYPIYIFGFQFKSSVNYHLKNRDASESAPCTINGKKSNINLTDLLAAGENMGLKKKKCKDIISQISLVVADFEKYAEESNIREKTFCDIKKILDQNKVEVQKKIFPPLDEFCEWCYNRVATKKQL